MDRATFNKYYYVLLILQFSNLKGYNSSQVISN